MTGAELALKRAHERNLVLVKDPSSKLQFSKSQVRVWKTLKKKRLKLSYCCAITQYQWLLNLNPRIILEAERAAAEVFHIHVPHSVLVWLG